jgi:hypothetical protein
MANWTSPRIGSRDVTRDRASSPRYDGGTRLVLASRPSSDDTGIIAGHHVVMISAGAPATAV